jgi:hypothetical protein
MQLLADEDELILSSELIWSWSGEFGDKKLFGGGCRGESDEFSDKIARPSKWRRKWRIRLQEVAEVEVEMPKSLKQSCSLPDAEVKMLNSLAKRPSGVDGEGEVAKWRHLAGQEMWSQYLKRFSLR